MTLLQFFEKVYGENVFEAPRTQERTDKRIASYTFAKHVFKMNNSEIGKELGRNRTTVSQGIKRFEGLLEVGDKYARKIYIQLVERANSILTHTDDVISTIDIRADEVFSSKKIMH